MKSETQPPIWVMHMKRLKYHPELMEKVNDGYIALGWKWIDLHKLKDREAIKVALQAKMKEKSIPMVAGQLFRYAHVIKKGDYVVLPISGSSVVKIGKIADDELLRNDDFDEDYVYQRKVEWHLDVERADFSQPARNTLGSFTSICLGSDLVLKEVETLLSGKVVQKGKETEQEVEEEEMEFALEKYLEEFLIENWDRINFGEDLSLYVDEVGNAGNQYSAGNAGNIDILAQDTNNNFVVIELKKGRKSDAVVGQVMRYMGWVRKNLATNGEDVRGLIIVGEKDARLEYAISEVSDKVELKLYSINFNLL